MKILGENDRLPAGSTVATIGMFDGVHLGHATLVDFLKQQAADQGKQSLLITFLRHPRQVLHPDEPFKLIMPLDERLKQIEALGPDLLLQLDFTAEFAKLDSSQFIELLRDRYGVSLLVAGYNHRFGHNRGETFRDYCRHGEQLGVKMVKAPEYLGPYAPVSSTIVRGLIAAGRVVDAMHCMGRPHMIRGKVVHGFHNGRGLGFPTANVGKIDPQLLLPHNGAYAVLAHVDGQVLQGMANIGKRPTLDNGDQLSIEVNLFDFDDDIYGKDITLEFISFLRLEFKMCGLEELKHQLTLDRNNAKRILNDYSTTKQ
ncbi:MAG: riboflavin biosynthesis protein RibF [Muribaculaceae bacterium]|jgi:riboflavin kinase/FMN adenylyltransferase|nr:riboflavin biosynthesis protein RibF [Muribaculaceae bacterium]MBR0493880.1 riboflavin biosynthesis protein RibF [Muribaculaceae bacterium]